MGNIVKVSRAPRVRKVKFQEVKRGDFYLQDHRPDMYVLCEKDSPARWVHTPFSLPYVIELGSNEVIPFESFEAMCKWVAGGRKLEDLQGDAKDEWVDVKSLPLGSIAEVVIDSQIPHSKWVKKTFIRTVDNVTVLETGEQMKGLDLPFMVWPLGPGDSITIEPEKP